MRDLQPLPEPPAQSRQAAFDFVDGYHQHLLTRVQGDTTDRRRLVKAVATSAFVFAALGYAYVVACVVLGVLGLYVPADGVQIAVFGGATMTFGSALVVIIRGLFNVTGDEQSGTPTS